MEHEKLWCGLSRSKITIHALDVLIIKDLKEGFKLFVYSIACWWVYGVMWPCTGCIQSLCVSRLMWYYCRIWIGMILGWNKNLSAASTYRIEKGAIGKAGNKFWFSELLAIMWRKHYLFVKISSFSNYIWSKLSDYNFFESFIPWMAFSLMFLNFKVVLDVVPT